VQIILHQQDNWLVLEIGDDGQGFDAAATQSDRAQGLGLRGMRERLALVGGDLSIDSRPGLGTHLLARVPLPRDISRHAAGETRSTS
jgi:two-component system NarL family sensor kinase